MRFFDIWKKDYDELTDEDKKFLEIFTGTVCVLGGGVAGVALGYQVGSLRTSRKWQKRAKIAAGKAYNAGWYDSGCNMMEVVHKYNPREFKEIMKTAQDNHFGKLYEVCLKALPDNTAMITGGDR